MTAMDLDDPAPGAEPSVSVLAQAVRELRSRAQLTLKELGLRSGIAPSTLSKIENGQLSPTYEKIVMLASGLGVDVAELFGSGQANSAAIGRRSVCRKGQGVRHSTEQYDYEMLCTDVTGKQFVPIVAQLRAHSTRAFPSMIRHDGEEFVYVIEGQVTIHSDFYEPLVLDKGDSCYFNSQMGHVLVSTGRTQARIVWICSKNTPMP